MLHATNSCVADSASGVALDRFFSDATQTGGGNVTALSCTSDPRQVVPGDVYIALPANFDDCEDGYAQARRAVAQGAAAIVCEQALPIFDVPTYLVADCRVAYAQLCQELSGRSSLAVPVIAVTGTHGKSTTIALLEAIFARAGKHCGKISGLGCYDGMAHSAGVCTPTPAELASRMERMVAAGCSHMLLEVNSESLSQSAMAGVVCDAVCITNVSDAHLDLHNTVQSYRMLKRRIFDYLSPNGVAVINADDPVSSKWLARLDTPALTFGTKGQAEVTAEVVSFDANEQVFVITAGNESVAVRTTMIGRHHVANCLAAATIALAYDIDLRTIAVGIESLEPLPGRMERVDCGQGFPVFVDAADTAESLRAALRTARHLCEGRVVCVVGDCERATYTEALAIEHVIRRLADVAIVARPFAEGEESVADSEQHAVVEVVHNRDEAIACAVMMAKPGDVVVIAGSQGAPQRTYGSLARKSPAADVAIVRRILATRLDALRRVAA